MANYVGRYRTNYFHVSSEKAFDEWMEQYVSGADKLISVDGIGFYGYDSFCFSGPDGKEVNEGEAISKLQEILDDNNTCIVEEIGYEKFRYFTATATIITKDNCKTIAFQESIMKHVQKLLHDESYDTGIAY